MWSYPLWRPLLNKGAAKSCFCFIKYLISFWFQIIFLQKVKYLYSRNFETETIFMRATLLRFLVAASRNAM